MARDTTPAYEPHLAYRDGEVPMAKYWYVRMKTGTGEYVWLSDETPIKRQAAREMRRIREEMGRMWLEARNA